MFGATPHNVIKPDQVASLLNPGYDFSAGPKPDPEPKTTPAWVPWAVGAALGGGILYLLLRD